MFFDITKIKILLKLLIILCLSAIFYVYYFTEVVTKYANGYKNVVVSNEEFDGGMKPPILTACALPHYKIAALKKYDINGSALTEPSEKILHNFNNSFVDLFREVTFSLDNDFHMYLTIWVYDKNGWEPFKIKLSLGTKNIIKVNSIGCLKRVVKFLYACISQAYV